MPIFEYQLQSGTGCDKCRPGFEYLQKASDAELQNCPVCNAAVRRLMSAPSINKSSPSLDPKNLERHGFTQYRKAGKGAYEKTAGTGPAKIEKD